MMQEMNELEIDQVSGAGLLEIIGAVAAATITAGYLLGKDIGDKLTSQNCEI